MARSIDNIQDMYIQGMSIQGMSIRVEGENFDAPLAMCKYFNEDEWEEAYEFYQSECSSHEWERVTIQLITHDGEYEVLEDLVLSQQQKISSWGTTGLEE